MHFHTMSIVFCYYRTANEDISVFVDL